MLFRSKALTKAVSASTPGDKVEVVVLRGGKEKTIEVELGERENNTMVFYSDDGNVHFPGGDHNSFVWQNGDDEQQIEIMIKGIEGLHQERGFMGVEVDDLNEQMGNYFDVEDGEGALITSVTEDSAAEEAGLKAGDVIVLIGDEEIESAEDVHEALAGTEPEQKLDIKVIRKGKSKTLNITLGEVPENQMFKFMEMSGGDHNIHISSPKMLHHGMQAPHQMHKEMRVLYEGSDDLKEMRHELEKMKEELEKMKDELDKN